MLYDRSELINNIGITAIIVIGFVGGGLFIRDCVLEVETMQQAGLEACVKSLPEGADAMACAAAKGDLPNTMSEGGILLSKDVDEKERK